MLCYKATLFKATEDQICRPIDTCLLHERSYSIAENVFFNQNGWDKHEDLYVDIDEFPREVETGTFY